MSIMLIISMLVFFPVLSFAAESDTPIDDDFNEDYLVIRYHNCSLSINGLTANISAEIQANISTSISIKAELQKLKSGSYSTVETWNASKTGISLSLSESRLINVFSTYRLKVTFTAGSETVVSYAYP